MKTITEHKEIEKLWPTRAAFARAIDVDQNTVKLWARRNRIPVEYWCRIVQACESIGKPVMCYELAACMDIDRKPGLRACPAPGEYIDGRKKAPTEAGADA